MKLLEVIIVHCSSDTDSYYRFVESYITCLQIVMNMRLPSCPNNEWYVSTLAWFCPMSSIGCNMQSCITWFPPLSSRAHRCGSVSWVVLEVICNPALCGSLHFVMIVSSMWALRSGSISWVVLKVTCNSALCGSLHFVMNMSVCAHTGQVPSHE